MKRVGSAPDDGAAWSASYASACENWSRAEAVREQRGRPPKRAKYGKWRSMQQRAFAAGVMHSVRIYEALQPHEREIRAMLCARGMIDEAPEARKVIGSASGVRPSMEDASDAQTAISWLDANCYVAGCDRQHRAETPDGHLRVRLVTDSVANGLARTSGQRTFSAVEQLCAWVYLWADPAFELKWLGMAIGLGVFTTGATGRHVCPSIIQGIVDYEVNDPHAGPIQVSAARADREGARPDHTKDYVTVYGPLTLVNAACQKHSTVNFTDADTGEGGKLVSLKWKTGPASQHRDGVKRQLYAAYPAPAGKSWACPALDPAKRCRQRLYSK